MYVITQTPVGDTTGVAAGRDLMSCTHDSHTDPVPSAQPVYAAAALWREKSASLRGMAPSPREAVCEFSAVPAASKA